MALVTSLGVFLNTVYSKTGPLGDTPVDNVIKNYALALASGTGAGNADFTWRDQRTLGPSANESLDFSPSTADAFGVTLTFVKVKMMIFFAATANTNQVVVSRPAANGIPWTAASATITLDPGGIFVFFSPVGVAVTAATGDLITITNSAAGTSVVYDIIFVGASA